MKQVFIPGQKYTIELGKDRSGRSSLSALVVMDKNDAKNIPLISSSTKAENIFHQLSDGWLNEACLVSDSFSNIALLK